MTIRRSYQDALDGQMHVMEAGSGQAIILLPWFPRSGAMYVDELETIASHGYRAIALDPMGRGNSISQNQSITVQRHADNIEHVVDAMGIENPIVLGGHYSSMIAAELASRPSFGAVALVIDGGVAISELLSSQLVGKVQRVPSALLPQKDGSHREYLWANMENIYDIYAPGYEIGAGNAHVIYRAIADFLAAYLQTGGAALKQPPVEDYPFTQILADLHIPALFLSADTEPLVSAVENMEAIYGGPFATYTFQGDHPLHFPERKGEFGKELCVRLSLMVPT